MKTPLKTRQLGSIIWICDADDRQVATVDLFGPLDIDETQRLAQLFCRAPELLAAARKVVAALNEYTSDGQEHHEALIAAISSDLAGVVNSLAKVASGKEAS